MKAQFVSLALALIAGCSRAPSEPSSSSTSTSTSTSSATSSPTATATPTSGPVLALHWDDPASWQRRKPSTSMRKAEYLVPRAGSDTEDAECFVITFGPGQGGGVVENIDRWVGQFGSPPAPPARTRKTVNGLTVDPGRGRRDIHADAHAGISGRTGSQVRGTAHGGHRRGAERVLVLQDDRARCDGEGGSQSVRHDDRERAAGLTDSKEW